jgi:membrane protein implicated in regulation of membrane protease activity
VIARLLARAPNPGPRLVAAVAASHLSLPAAIWSPAWAMGALLVVWMLLVFPVAVVIGRMFRRRERQRPRREQ